MPKKPSPSCSSWLAPFRFLGFRSLRRRLRPHPRHGKSIARFVFPRAVRDGYRERLLLFRLNTLPNIKHGLQSRIYRFLRGYRRRKLAAMAGSLYRSGQQAVTDIRDSYAHSRIREGDLNGQTSSPSIPGAFPDVAITSQGDEQLVLFPSYAKRHVKRDWASVASANQASAQQGGPKDEEFWRLEYERHEDEKAVVDVDIRGWIYSPHVGPMTRRNRMLIGLARQLSGIPAPSRTEQPSGAAATLAPGGHSQEDMHDQEKIAREAALIERRGQEEKQVAYRGGYSEQPANGDGNGVLDSTARGSRLTVSAAASPLLAARQVSNANELSETELAVANVNLMARVAPFLTNPLVAMPITIFFYNDSQSQSRTVLTNDAGHFIVRAQLDFVPTHARVLANEKLSATQQVEITELRGVSLISDVDDTVKHSNISAGAREIFRNTFVRELADLKIEGVEQWYSKMHELGVSLHYCSNSPWQLFPVLASFFKLGGLPPGSLHLKQYSGMLQGIFEPVAERKKTTLNHLLRDFPERRFLLVGDSGEADLEVYTELALANPGRILAIFIRDVTTPPEKAGFFDSAAADLARRKASPVRSSTGDEARRGSAVGSTSGDENYKVSANPGPAMGTLIDFSQDPDTSAVGRATAPSQAKKAEPRKASASDLLERKPPPRPAKPAALRGRQASTGSSTPSLSDAAPRAGSPLPIRRPVESTPPPLSRARQPPPGSGGNGWKQTASTSDPDKPPPPPPRPRAAASSTSLGPPTVHNRRQSANSDIDFEPLPPPSAPATSFGMNYFGGSRSAVTTPSGSPVLGATAVNKKLDLWLRRLERAHEQLDREGVALYTWRKGQDVMVEAAAIVDDALKEMGMGR
ncbi:hypothetical protein HIM_04221 [Hirsutella minnesotensis 3608]|uniref:Phosphatidate phosphatase APP1 catalytic domain-containing protein n=1 Tax=Hirsutella minnesotensis 3608 TaxID=1043627 RepID=A0A0F8A1T3_9HYPO|nr:hypothetical protein HIM_04221 [Hirsutella minnesotensis 3608]